MYAVVTTGGKQYRVEAGSELTVERLAADAGSSVTFDRVLLVGDGDTVTVGTPTVDGASVSATVLGETLGPKLVIFKFKQKVKYRRTTGHRQHLTRVRIDEISAAGKTAKAEKAEAAKADAGTEAAKPRRTRKPAAVKAEATEPEETKAETATKTEAKPRARRAKAAKADEGTESKSEAPKPRRTRKPAPKAESEE